MGTVGSATVATGAPRGGILANGVSKVLLESAVGEVAMSENALTTIRFC